MAHGLLDCGIDAHSNACKGSIFTDLCFFIVWVRKGEQMRLMYLGLCLVKKKQ